MYIYDTYFSVFFDRSLYFAAFYYSVIFDQFNASLLNLIKKLFLNVI